MNGTSVFLLIGRIVIGRFFLLPTALMGLLQVSSDVKTKT